MQNNNDKAMRDAFEAWAKLNKYPIEMMQGEYACLGYENGSTNDCWIGWQAATQAAPQGDVGGWQDIEKLPYNEDVLLFGSYIYGGDKDRTEYIYLGSKRKEMNSNKDIIETSDETLNIEQFSHWQPLPNPPIQTPNPAGE